MMGSFQPAASPMRTTPSSTTRSHPRVVHGVADAGAGGPRPGELLTEGNAGKVAERGEKLARAPRPPETYPLPDVPEEVEPGPARPGEDEVVQPPFGPDGNLVGRPALRSMHEKASAAGPRHALLETNPRLGADRRASPVGPDDETACKGVVPPVQLVTDLLMGASCKLHVPDASHHGSPRIGRGLGQRQAGFGVTDIEEAAEAGDQAVE